MFAGKGFPTFTATVVCFPSVNFLMQPQFKHVAKGLPTLLTHMSCFSRMNFLDISMGCILLGGISTCGAFEVSLFRVSYQVVKESKSLQEVFPTATALERPLGGIGSLLLLMFGAEWEGCPISAAV